jgi:hypothetical protein
MQVTTIDESDAGKVAINLDPVVHARLYPGKEPSLALHFASGEKNKLVVQSPQAEKV